MKQRSLFFAGIGNAFRRTSSTGAGFTLIEVIVAMSVIAVGVLSAVAISSVMVKAGESNQRKVVATALAREGIELVRNIRDSNWQARAVQQANGVPAINQVAWDCALSSGEQAGIRSQTANPAAPLTCDFRMSTETSRNYVPIPWVTAGSNTTPWLQPPPTGYANSVTASNDYLICPRTLNAATVYYPAFGSLESLCEDTIRYHRRVVLSPATGGDTSANGPGVLSQNIKIQSFVTWLERAAKGQPEILVEEYLTDWRAL